MRRFIVACLLGLAGCAALTGCSTRFESMVEDSTTSAEPLWQPESQFVQVSDGKVGAGDALGHELFAGYAAGRSAELHRIRVTEAGRLNAPGE
ncbi:MAG: hypothetical protein L0Y44_02475 [Phycisphaerales bacterium]|nr:hypothetical protein [Phycisphaerales bacterium]MCI0674729.1 hypothetical protein [Phycisphaerales bacterium]